MDTINGCRVYFRCHMAESEYCNCKYSIRTEKPESCFFLSGEGRSYYSDGCNNLKAQSDALQYALSDFFDCFHENCDITMKKIAALLIRKDQEEDKNGTNSQA